MDNKNLIIHLTIPEAIELIEIELVQTPNEFIKGQLNILKRLFNGKESYETLLKSLIISQPIIRISPGSLPAIPERIIKNRTI